MPRQSHKIVSFPIFEFEVKVVLTDSVIDSVNEHDSTILTDKDKDNLTALTVYTEVETHKHVILFFDFQASAGTIAHEAFHAIMEIFDFIEADMEEEVFAYHLDYLVQSIHDFQTNINKTNTLQNG